MKKAGSPAGAPLSLAQPVDSLVALLTRQEHFTKLATLLLVGETALCFLIIYFVSCMCSLASLWVFWDELERGKQGVDGGRKLRRRMQLLSSATAVSTDVFRRTWVDHLQEGGFELQD